ncbi:hypothetical protein HDU98_010831 [Podochytrium sp. JEL0797]|nr:hypothetical protein HDU98_010831 [Podochytrium sp. JEL0797]
MCYVKVKSSAIAEVVAPIAQATVAPVKDVTMAALASTESWLANNLNEDWFQGQQQQQQNTPDATSSPLEYDIQETNASVPRINGDWMNWLETISSFPADTTTMAPPMEMGTVVSPTMTETTAVRSPEYNTLAAPPTAMYIPAMAPVNLRKRTSRSDSLDSDGNVRRTKNTDAARKSRARKAALIDSLESKSDMLENDKARLATRIAVLENNERSFAQREVDLKQRVAFLEEQLTQSHRALLSQNGL